MKKLKPILKIFACLLITFALLLFYEFSVRMVWEAVFWVYYAATAAAAILFVLLNRGFSAWFYRREELPKDWSEEQKDAFFAARKERLDRSRPVLYYALIPLCLCFFFDILCLFLWGPLVELLPFLA